MLERGGPAVQLGERLYFSYLMLHMYVLISQADENETTDWTFWTGKCIADFTLIWNHLKISLCDVVRQ